MILRLKIFFFTSLDEPRDRNEKRACQTSIDTHPVHTAEANAERAEIIATLYTEYRLRSTAILADSSRGKASLLGIEDRLIVQVGDSVAFLRSSEEDVYYRIDSICGRKSDQHGVAKEKDVATTPFDFWLQLTRNLSLLQARGRSNIERVQK